MSQLHEQVVIVPRKLCDKGQCENQNCPLGFGPCRHGVPGKCPVPAVDLPDQESRHAPRPAAPRPGPAAGTGCSVEVCHVPQAVKLGWMSVFEAQGEFYMLGLCGHMPWEEGEELLPCLPCGGAHLDGWSKYGQIVVFQIWTV